MHVCEKVPLAECYAATGRAPIGVRWVDVQKKSGQFRSRFVAKEIKLFDDPSLFAGTPPFEALKYLLSKLSCNEHYVIAAARRTIYF